MGDKQSGDGLDRSAVPEALLETIDRCEVVIDEFDQRAEEAVGELDRQLQDPMGSGPDWGTAERTVIRAATKAREALAPEATSLRAAPMASDEERIHLLRDSYLTYLNAWTGYLEDVVASPDLAWNPEAREGIDAASCAVPWEALEPPSALIPVEEPQPEEVPSGPNAEVSPATDSPANPTEKAQVEPPPPKAAPEERHQPTTAAETSTGPPTTPRTAQPSPEEQGATTGPPTTVRPQPAPHPAPRAPQPDSTIAGVAQARSIVRFVALVVLVAGLLYAVGVLAVGPELPSVVSDEDGIRVTDPEPWWQLRIVLAVIASLVTAFACALLIGLWGLLHSHVRLLQLADNRSGK